MNIEKGVVSDITTRQVTTKYGVKDTFSIKVGGEWYGCGFKRPDVEENDFIEFTWDANGKYRNANVDSIKKVAAAAAERAPAIPTSSAPMGQDDYWGRKESRDLDTQKRIQLQASRNAALEATRILVDTGAVKLPATQNKKYEAILAVIDEITARFYHQTSELYVVEIDDTPDFPEEEAA